MSAFVTIYTMSGYQEAVMLKSRLEAGGLHVFFRNEHMIQMKSVYSPAVGGIDLQVPEEELELARDLLISFGYLKEERKKESVLIVKLDKMTSSWPVIGRQAVHIRLFVLTALILIFIVLLLVAVLLSIG